MQSLQTYAKSAVGGKVIGQVLLDMLQPAAMKDLVLDSMQSNDVKPTYASVSKYLLRKEIEITRNVVMKLIALGMIMPVIANS